MKNKQKHYLSHRDVHAELMKDPTFRRAHVAIQPEMDAIRTAIEARIKKAYTQAEIAAIMGTQQSVISRVEAGKSSPTVAFLQRFAKALNARLEIRFLPR